MRQAISVPRANLISLGICLGKFSKTEKFRLHITGLDLLGRYAKNKVRPSLHPSSLLEPSALSVASFLDPHFLPRHRSGSNRMEKCPSSTGITSSKPISVELQRIRPNIKE